MTLTTAEELYAFFVRSSGVCTDSRKVAPGVMFFALKGDNFDGNLFAAAALAAGAAVAVMDDAAMAEMAAERFGEGRIALVASVLIALQDMSSYHRRALGIPVIAITGSNGKTTTKELTARVLSSRYRIAVTKGNLNNHIGVPLTLLEMDGATEMGIVEMGAGGPGEIALLARIAAPDYGLITNIGLAHLEGFGSAEGVRRGKGELFDYLASNGGTAFYRKDDPALAQMVSERPHLKAVGYKTAPPNTRSNLEGVYNIYNISAALAVGEFFGVEPADALSAVAAYQPDNNRSQVVLTSRNKLIVDCYNANPSSMAAALDNFLRSDFPQYPLKSVILGDMLELGEWTEREHERIVNMVCNNGLDDIYLVGKHFAAAVAALGLCGSDANRIVRTNHREPSGIYVFADTAQLAARLESHTITGHAILIKGSRGVKLETLTGSL